MAVPRVGSSENVSFAFTLRLIIPLAHPILLLQTLAATAIGRLTCTPVTRALPKPVLIYTPAVGMIVTSGAAGSTRVLGRIVWWEIQLATGSIT